MSLSPNPNPHPPSPTLKRRHILFLLVAALLLLLGAWWGASRWYQQRLILDLRSQVTAKVTPRGTALSIAMNRRLTRLQGLYAYVQSEPTLNDFSIFARELFAGSRGIRYIAAAPDNTIRHIYPLENNASLLGSSIHHDVSPEQLEDLQRSIQLRVITLSDPNIVEGQEMTVDAWLAQADLKSQWQQRRHALISECVDLTEWICDLFTALIRRRR